MCNVDKNYRFVAVVVSTLVCNTVCFHFTGIEDEGFEMLEQLAYLYLANNKVSHTADSQMFVLSANLKSAYVIQKKCYILHVLFYSILL